MPLLVAGLGNHDFWMPDEPFVAEIAREMAVSGDYVTPRLNGQPFLEKPPLHYMLAAVSMKAIGVTPLAARLPAMLATLGTILLTYLLGDRLLGRRAGLWGALALPTIFVFFYAAHYGLVDPTLAVFVVLGFLGGAYASGEDARPWGMPLAYLGAALAFLAKGVVGPGIVVLGLLSYSFVRRAGPKPARKGHLVGLAVFIAVIGPWVFLLWRAGGTAFLREAFVANSIGRFIRLPGLIPVRDRIGAHTAGPLTYLLYLPEGFLPWTPLLLLAVAHAAAAFLKRGIKGGAAPDSSDPAFEGEKFLWSGALPALVVLSLASTKREIYLLPLYPLLALLAAGHAVRLASGDVRRGRPVTLTLAAQALLVSLMSLAVPAFYYGQARAASRGESLAAPALAALALGLLAAFMAFLAVRALLRRRLGDFFKLQWGQAAIALLTFAVLCVPLLDAGRSLGPFFHEARRVEESRGRLPVLFTNHESLIGFADLVFGRTLPQLEPGRLTEPTDILTTADGFTVLREVMGPALTVLTRHRTGGDGSLRELYLVAYPGEVPAGGAGRPGSDP